MEPGTNKAFGLALRKLRLTAGITQDRLAMLADMDRSHISMLERGKRSPTLETMISICRGLGLKLHVLAEAIERALEQSDVNARSVSRRSGSQEKS